MPKISKIVQSFNAGELSTLMGARIDQQKYQSGCRTLENYIPLVYGGAQRRPGLEFIGRQKDLSAKARMIPFERSVTNTYAMSFENQAIRFFKGGARVYESAITLTSTTEDEPVSVKAAASHQFSTGDWVLIEGVATATSLNDIIYQITRVDTDDFTLRDLDGNDINGTGIGVGSGGTVKRVFEVTSPYLTADLPNIKVEHSADVMYLTHDDYEPRKLSRTGDTSWTLEATDLRTGPFMDLNTVLSRTIAVAERSGGGIDTGASVTLTAAGHTPFVSGVTAGQLPNGITTAITVFADYTGTVTDTTNVTATGHGFSTNDIVFISGTTSYNGQWVITKIGNDNFYILKVFVANDATGEVVNATFKSQTGSLLEIIFANPNDSVASDFTGAGQSNELQVPKGVTWDFTTNGTWTGTVKLEREYNNSGAWETLSTVTSKDNKNTVDSEVETFAKAQYRMNATVLTSGTADCQLSIRDSSHVGIVEITDVASSTSATATVRESLGLATDTAVAATHRWAEGSWSNLTGFPKTVSISPEDRLVFAGTSNEPLTVWGSEVGDWTNFLIGTLDSDPYAFSLVGTGQQNEIQWSLPKKAMVFGTIGGEHIFGSPDIEKVVTPTNAQAELQTTYGSENIRARIVNQAILFVQRGGKKIREFLYNFDQDSHKADDLTIFAEHITGTGIVDMFFQRTPDPILWCIRADGETAIMNYERDQDVFSWSRIVTDGAIESGCVIYGGARSEDEVWVSVNRTIGGTESRYIERFRPQKFTFLDEVVFVDSAVISLSASDAQNVILASDTVRCGAGLCNSSLCGGVVS